MMLCACIANPLNWDHQSHVVQTGENLATIALRYEVRVQDLISWNQISNPNLIRPGQTLRIAPPPGWSPASTTPSTPDRTVSTVDQPAPTSWYWPAKGKLVPNRNAAGVGDGINISNRVGDAVFAASNGKVVYSGSGLKGYGKLIIIKHNATYLSAYGYNREILVKEGEQVKGGQRIAKMGEGPGRVPMLHFEIRRDGKPVDPLEYLKVLKP